MLSLMMGHAFDAALRHATKLVYVRRVVTRTHVASGNFNLRPIMAKIREAAEGSTDDL